MRQPQYIISVAPLEDVGVRDLFKSGADSPMDLLRDPGQFRHAGWDLQTRDSPRIVGGDYLEVANGARKLIRWYEDGTLIVRVAADSSFLGWGKHAAQFAQSPRIHPMALIEVTTAVVHFYRRALPFFNPTPTDLRWRVEFVDADIGGNKLYLLPFGFNTLSWMFDDNRHALESSNPSKEIDSTTNELTDDPDAVAYRLIERVYLFFGLAVDTIPYVIELDGTRRIDVAAFGRGQT